ncbi:MAG: MFS transporter [Caldilineaceae bacterium]
MNIKRLFATTYGHFSIDIINSSTAMVLTAMAAPERFNLSVGDIAFGALLYQICASMSQPIFGSLTDRLRGRWVGGLGLLWTIIFYSLAMFMPSYPTFLGCLMIGGLGSGAFHAAGVYNAPASGGKRSTLATSIFFLGGQSGLAIGPIIAGFLLTRGGIQRLPITALAMLPAVVVMLLFMNSPITDLPNAKSAGKVNGRKGAVTLVVIFMLLITMRSGTAQAFSTLLPKFFDLQGLQPSEYGLLIGWFTFLGALGTFSSGFLGDRFDRRWLMIISLLISTPFYLWMLNSDGISYYMAAAIASFSVSISHTILIVMAQELAPKSRGLVGGLVLGFIFASGSTVAWLAGEVADVTGLPIVLNALSFLPIGAALCALLLPGATRPEPIVAPAPAAAD